MSTSAFLLRLSNINLPHKGITTPSASIPDTLQFCECCVVSQMPADKSYPGAACSFNVRESLLICLLSSVPIAVSELASLLRVTWMRSLLRLERTGRPSKQLLGLMQAPFFPSRCSIGLFQES